jgi:predicted transcriptional regulator
MDQSPVDELIKFIEENNPTNNDILEKLNLLKTQEENIINRSYLTGFYDKESGKAQKGNYYREKYGPNWYTKMIENLKVK